MKNNQLYILGLFLAGLLFVGELNVSKAQTVSAPSNLQITSSTKNSVQLQWQDNASDEAYYTLEFSKDGGTSWKEFNILASNVTTTAYYTLNCQTSYSYRLRAYRLTDNTYSEYSNVALATTGTCTISLYSSMSSTNSSIEVGFYSDMGDEWVYRVERSSNGTTGWTQIAQVPASENYFTDTTVNCSASYYYRVRGYRSASNTYTAYSANSLRSTWSCRSSAPGNLSVTFGTSSASLSWTDNSAGETGFRIYRSEDGGISWDYAAWFLSPGTRSYVDSNIGCLSYMYRVQALYDYGYSSTISGSTGSACTALPAPNIFTAYARERRFTMVWTYTDRDESNFRVERSTDAGTSWTEVAVEDTYRSYSDSTILCGIDYQYRVRSYRSIDNSYSPYATSIPIKLPCATALADVVCTYTPLFSILGSSSDYPSFVRMSGDGSRAFVIRGNFELREPLEDLYRENLEVWDINTQTQLYMIEDVDEFVVSDDGLRVAYFSGEELYLWDNGTVSQLTINLGEDYKSLSMNGAGTKIAFIAANFSTGLGSIRVWTDGGGLENPISETSQVSVASLSGDGTGLIFLSFDNPTGEGTGGLSYFYRWDASNGIVFLDFPFMNEGSDQVVDLLTVDDSGSNFAFRFDDGSYTNTEAYYQIAVWNEANGGYEFPAWDIEAPRTILYDFASIYPAGWSSNGERLMFVAPYDLTGENPDGYVRENQVYAEYFFYDNGNIRQITSSVQLSQQPYVMAISDDGSRILAFTMLPFEADSTAYDAAIPYLAIGDCGSIMLPTPEIMEIYANSEGVHLSWADFSDSESGFRLERSDDGISWLEIAQLPANTESYTDSGVACSMSYDYRLRAVRDDDEAYSAYSNVVTGTTDTCTPPVTPTDLTVTDTNQTSVSLSWIDNADNETSYSLERSLDGAPWTEIQVLAANSTSYTDHTTVCNSSYQYRLRAYRSDSSQYSGYSNVATGTTTVCPPPTAPTALNVASFGHTNINLAWTDNASDETSYSLERSLDGANWTEIQVLAANSTSYNDTTALCNSSYQYRIRAYRSGDSQFSDYSNVITGTTDLCITLNAPTNIQLAGSTESSLSLSWADNSGNESGYEIERSLDGSNWTVLSSLPANSTSYSDNGLTCSTGYQYRIRSKHLGTASYSSYGNSAVFTTVSCPALVASVLSRTDATQNSISLSWTVDSSATSFTLSYFNGTGWVNLGIFPVTTTTYTHSGLACNTNYQYQITTYRAADAASMTSSAFSTMSGACPPLLAPNAPIVLNTEPALVSLQISAMPATATSMSLERSIDGLSWTNLGAASNNYIDTAVVCGNSYQYRLVASRSNDGMTSTSATAVAFTDACPIPTVVGVYRNGLWTFVASNNTAVPSISFNFGDNSWQPLVGDWDGDGLDGVGIYRNGEFVLRNVASADSPENRFNFGTAEAGWQALVGDWNGDGRDSLGLYKDGLFILTNDNANIHYRFNYGQQQTGWQAVAGDWDGNGADGIGLYKDGLWMLANDVNNPDASSQRINYGPNQAGWTAIVGDWNGDGQDSIGLYSNGTWRMRTNSATDATETSLSFGQTGDIPLAIFEN